MSEPILEVKELLDAHPVAEWTTRGLFHVLSSIYPNADEDWKQCVITEALGYKTNKFSRHEGVMLTVKRGGTSFYVVIDRNLELASDSAGYGTKAVQSSMVSSSSPVPARDGVKVHRSRPLMPGWYMTFKFTFTADLPFMIGALAGEAISKARPNYSLLGTNCYAFAAVLRDLLRKYAKDEHIGLTEDPRLKVEEQKRQEQEERERREQWEREREGELELERVEEGENSEGTEAEGEMKTAKGGTYRGILITTDEFVLSILVEAHPILLADLEKFKEKVRLHILF